MALIARWALPYPWSQVRDAQANTKGREVGVQNSVVMNVVVVAHADGDSMGTRYTEGVDGFISIAEDFNVTVVHFGQGLYLQMVTITVILAFPLNVGSKVFRDKLRKVVPIFRLSQKI